MYYILYSPIPEVFDDTAAADVADAAAAATTDSLSVPPKTSLRNASGPSHVSYVPQYAPPSASDTPSKYISEFQSDVPPRPLPPPAGRPPSSSPAAAQLGDTDEAAPSRTDETRLPQTCVVWKQARKNPLQRNTDDSDDVEL